ncbi:effector binding domain-containing protein [Virgibacillus halodenitrificans]|uniref:effector binding domain-containing protein n=1 Tax=Virgibacillus halodenitrificans TaxID=1482 RepID=UPI0024BFE598|nr:effector binding domain-containing protein [Virgibacillus halodenitrificans]WHX24576.1 effector binding domain-containing protein [Virgibacillus halodenitrificans]
MECRKVNEIFRVVGIKGSGVYTNLDTEVPKLARELLTRLDEVENHSGTEIALFEPKRDAKHLEGHYYVGIIVNEPLKNIPVGMDYIETSQTYLTTKGKIINIDSLYRYLSKWAYDKGYKRNLESYIVETYHPMDNGEEEVVIYFPIHL